MGADISIVVAGATHADTIEIASRPHTFCCAAFSRLHQRPLAHHRISHRLSAAKTPAFWCFYKSGRLCVNIEVGESYPCQIFRLQVR